MCFNVFWQVLIQVYFMLVILHQYYREGSEKKICDTNPVGGGGQKGK